MITKQQMIADSIQRIEASRKADNILIPEKMLSAITKRGQNGKPVLRGRKSAASK